MAQTNKVLTDFFCKVIPPDQVSMLCSQVFMSGAIHAAPSDKLNPLSTGFYFFPCQASLSQIDWFSLSPVKEGCTGGVGTQVRSGNWNTEGARVSSRVLEGAGF